MSLKGEFHRVQVESRVLAQESNRPDQLHVREGRKATTI